MAALARIGSTDGEDNEDASATAGNAADEYHRMFGVGMVNRQMFMASRTPLAAWTATQRSA
jgi:hypothetical protein